VNPYIIFILNPNPDKPELNIDPPAADQYPMTKTFNAVVPYQCPNFYALVIMPFGTNGGGSSVWNFEFRPL
jgi:hypothetical protein